MKAIAWAIICAAYLLIPEAEAAKWSEGFKAINVAVALISIAGFWICIIFEGKEK